MTRHTSRLRPTDPPLAPERQAHPAQRFPSGRSRPALAIASSVVAGLVMTGCAGAPSTPGPGSPADPGGGALDPCGLIRTDVLESEVGADLTQDGDAAPASRGMQCEWSFTTDGTPGTLSITAWEGGEFFSSALGDPLPGLGDDARVDRGLGAVLFRSGERVVQVQILPTARSASAEAIAHDIEAVI